MEAREKWRRAKRKQGTSEAEAGEAVSEAEAVARHEQVQAQGGGVEEAGSLQVRGV